MFRASLKDLEAQTGEFEVLFTSGQSQFATMTLEPGATSGEYGNEHPDSDQHLVVISGDAIAVVDGKEHRLGPGDYILIVAGEKHQIKNAGDQLLKTLNVYAPPAYPPRE